MTNLKSICDALKELGVIEVILLSDDDIPYVEFNGRVQMEYFKIKATNADFAEHDL